MLNLPYLPISSAHRRYAALGKQELFAELGWAGREASSGSHRSSALLLSLALASAGVSLPGRFLVSGGNLSGKMIETSASRLIECLKSRHLPPESIAFENCLENAADQLFGRRGIVAFIRDASLSGALIALIDGHNAYLACLAAQTLQPLEVIFWPLD